MPWAETLDDRPQAEHRLAHDTAGRCFLRCADSNHDGHAYVQQVLAKGAIAAVVETPLLERRPTRANCFAYRMYCRRCSNWPALHARIGAAK